MPRSAPAAVGIPRRPFPSCSPCLPPLSGGGPVAAADGRRDVARSPRSFSTPRAEARISPGRGKGQTRELAGDLRRGLCNLGARQDNRCLITPPTAGGQHARESSEKLASPRRWHLTLRFEVAGVPRVAVMRVLRPLPRSCSLPRRSRPHHVRCLRSPSCSHAVWQSAIPRVRERT